MRAVVKEIEEINHIIAQGQENSRRADLTFIERSLLARKLMEMSQSKDTIKAALTIDDTTLSRMLSVVETIPSALIEAIGLGQRSWTGSLGGAEEDRRPSEKGRVGAANSVQRRVSPSRGCRAFRFRACACGQGLAEAFEVPVGRSAHQR